MEILHYTVAAVSLRVFESLLLIALNCYWQSVWTSGLCYRGDVWYVQL